MKGRAGHDPGHPPPEPPPGFSWADYVARLADEHGSLAALALKVSQIRGFEDNAASIERGLRRLRGRGNLDGGSWGRRLLRAFGVPREVEARVAWMGAYHSRFTDLPRSVCLDQLRLWDRPPVSESRARIRIQLGLANAALRQADVEAAEPYLRAARASAGASPAARVELALVEAFVASKRRDRARVQALLGEAGALLDRGGLEVEAGACLRARWIDQRAYQKNNPPEGEAADHAGALALYESIPKEDVHPFVSSRRDSGLAYGRFRLGDRPAAIALAESACRHAGDGGYVRLRAMALTLLARVLGGDEGERVRQRAIDIARRLEDEELLGRIARRRSSGIVRVVTAG